MLWVDRVDGKVGKACDYCGDMTHVHSIDYNGCHIDLCTHCATEIKDDITAMTKIASERCKKGKKK